MKNRNATGAFKTFYHFRRTLSDQAALKWIKQFIAEDRPQLAANPLDVSTRKHMEAYYDKAYQGD